MTGPRGRGVVCAAILVGVVLAAIGWPALALVEAALRDAGSAAEGRGRGTVTPAPQLFLGTWSLLAVSLAWAVGTAALAVLLGWPLGRLLADRRRDTPWGAGLAWLAVLPLCLPAYLVSWSVWQAFGPGTPIGDWAMRGDGVVALRETALVAGLAMWSAPLVAWCVVAGRTIRPDRTRALVALDRLGWMSRLRLAWRSDRGWLLRGGALAAVAILAESVSFDLAQIRTYGFELRTLDATGGSPAQVVSLGWPGIVAALVLLAVAAWPGWARQGTAAGAGRLGGPFWPRWGIGAWLGLAALGLTLAPLGLLLGRIGTLRDAPTFLALYARAALNSIGVALAVGAIVAALTVTIIVVARAERRGLRTIALTGVALLALGAAGPATLVALAEEAAWNRPGVGPLIYDTAAIVVLGLVARIGVVAAAVAAIAVGSEPAAIAGLRRLDAPRSLGDAWRIGGADLLAAGAAAGMIATALAFAEVVVSGRLVPPRLELLATSTLNAMHYQQPDTVTIASLLAVALGGGAAAILVWVVRRRGGRGSGGTIAALVAATVSVGGCAPPEQPDRPHLPAARSIGTPGFGPTQFHTPRSIAAEPGAAEGKGSFFVVDKDGRVQRLGPDGSFELDWHMPDVARGRPVGMSVHPDGRLFIADTHYQRVMVYDREGRELARFGSYGDGPGQFIYPTDIAFGEDGRIYVAEYGGNDRIQIFAPDFRPLGSFGHFGREDGQFCRPQAIVFDRERAELYVADSNNHRITVFDPEGRELRSFGGPGLGPGDLSYPHGLLLLGDGTLLVVEYGGHRVQRLDGRPGAGLGASLGIWGGAGSENGLLKYPWDIAAVAGELVIVDGGNDRVTFTKLP